MLPRFGILVVAAEKGGDQKYDPHQQQDPQADHCKKEGNIWCLPFKRKNDIKRKMILWYHGP